jgi:DNA-binding beta-propeller fold protein YncE
LEQIADVPLGQGPVELAIDPGFLSNDADRVYIANGFQDALHILDVTPSEVMGGTNAASAKIFTGPHPTGVAVDLQTHRVYISRSDNANSAPINVVDVLDPRPEHLGLTTFFSAPRRSQPFDVVVDSVRMRLYVAHLGAAGGTGDVPNVHPNVTMVDLNTNAATVITTRSGARMIAADGRGQVYSATGGGVEVIDPAQARVVLTLPLGGRNPWSVAIHPTSGEIYST